MCVWYSETYARFRACLSTSPGVVSLSAAASAVAMSVSCAGSPSSCRYLSTNRRRRLLIMSNITSSDSSCDALLVILSCRGGRWHSVRFDLSSPHSLLYLSYRLFRGETSTYRRFLTRDRLTGPTRCLRGGITKLARTACDRHVRCCCHGLRSSDISLRVHALRDNNSFARARTHRLPLDLARMYGARLKAIRLSVRTGTTDARQAISDDGADSCVAQSGRRRAVRPARGVGNRPRTRCHGGRAGGVGRGGVRPGAVDARRDTGW